MAATHAGDELILVGSRTHQADGEATWFTERVELVRGTPAEIVAWITREMETLAARAGGVDAPPAGEGE